MVIFHGYVSHNQMVYDIMGIDRVNQLDSLVLQSLSSYKWEYGVYIIPTCCIFCSIWESLGSEEWGMTSMGCALYYFIVFSRLICFFV